MASLAPRHLPTKLVDLERPVLCAQLLFYASDKFLDILDGVATHPPLRFFVYCFGSASSAVLPWALIAAAAVSGVTGAFSAAHRSLPTRSLHLLPDLQSEPNL